MKVHIISDMEGVSGIVKWAQVNGGAPMYEEGRRLYTEEINAAVRGTKAAGATEIVVMDCHGAGKGWTFNSLIPDELDPDCEWVVQDEWTEYTEFLEQGCDAALFIGMHARAGTELGVLSHTVSGAIRVAPSAMTLRRARLWNTASAAASCSRELMPSASSAEQPTGIAMSPSAAAIATASVR